jgi:uncharacterized protein (TIGR00725 family)
MKVACLGASKLTDLAYAAMVAVGQLLARRGVEVLTGAFGGAMEAPAKGSSLEGGVSTGYSFLGITGNPHLSKTVDCSTFCGKKIAMELQFGVRLGHLLSADAFIFAPEGGTGTVAELMAICVFNMRAQKKVAILDPQGSWKAMLDSFFQLGIITSPAKDCIRLFATAEEAVEWICK